MRSPRGATTTIAALRDLGDAWTATVTISGTIRGLTGSAEGSGGPLDDGTGRLFVFVPPDADTFRLLQNGTPLELDVRPFGVWRRMSGRRSTHRGSRRSRPPSDETRTRSGDI